MAEKWRNFSGHRPGIPGLARPCVFIWASWGVTGLYGGIPPWAYRIRGSFPGRDVAPLGRETSDCLEGWGGWAGWDICPSLPLRFFQKKCTCHKPSKTLGIPSVFCGTVNNSSRVSRTCGVFGVDFPCGDDISCEQLCKSHNKRGRPAR